MKKRMVWLALLTGTFLVLAGLLLNQLAGMVDRVAPEQSGMPVPRLEGIEEQFVTPEEQGGPSLGMPVPGLEGVEEHVVTPDDQGVTISSGMPVPGLEGIVEQIVVEE